MQAERQTEGQKEDKEKEATGSQKEKKEKKKRQQKKGTEPEERNTNCLNAKDAKASNSEGKPCGKEKECIMYTVLRILRIYGILHISSIICLRSVFGHLRYLVSRLDLGKSSIFGLISSLTKTRKSRKIAKLAYFPINFN